MDLNPVLDSNTMTENDNNPLARLNELAAELFDTEAKAATLEEELKEAKRRIQKLAEQEIPDVMEALGIDTITTAGGLSVDVDRNAVRGGDLKTAPGLDYLRSIGEGGCIKTAVVVPFATGSDSDADEFVQRLNGEGIAASKSSVVNHMTLKSIVKKRLEEGEDVPLKTVGIDSFRKAKVTAKK